MSEHEPIRLPTPLKLLLDRLRRGWTMDIELAVASLVDTAYWQMARLEQLEDLLTDHGVKFPAKCFACQSANVEVEHRQRQRRHTCKECGYQWRLGIQDY